MRLRVILEPSEEGGYTAVVPSLPGCISEGDTREEALTNIQEASEQVSKVSSERVWFALEDYSHKFQIQNHKLQINHKLKKLNFKSR